jgi:hypothetical protein
MFRDGERQKFDVQLGAGIALGGAAPKHMLTTTATIHLCGTWLSIFGA